MDKYFAKDYDPRLDIPENAVDSLTDPRTGLIEDGGWDEMLSVIKEKDEVQKQRRREEKEARRMERKRRKEEGRRNDRVRKTESDSDSEDYARGMRSSRRKSETSRASSQSESERKTSRKRHRSRSFSPARSDSPERRRKSKVGGRHDDEVTTARRGPDSKVTSGTANTSRGVREWDKGKDTKA